MNIGKSFRNNLINEILEIKRMKYLIIILINDFNSKLVFIFIISFYRPNIHFIVVIYISYPLATQHHKKKKKKYIKYIK